MTEDRPSNAPRTVLEILRWTTGYFEDKGIDSARLDAELLLSHVLDLERIELYTQFNRPLNSKERDAYRALVKRRAQREPTAYILGHRHFWEFELAVDPRVLIPRPDTETLIRAALERIDDHSDARLIDVGTGSGAIAITLATERPELRIAATDNDPDALDVARKNATRLDVDDQISFFEGDLLDAVGDEWIPADYIVSNPPYVTDDERSELQPEVRDFEPTSALFAGPDGLDVIRRLIPAAHHALRPGATLLFEIGWRQGSKVTELLAESNFEDIEILSDYGDRDRVAAARKPTSSTS